ncbi:MAG TPA: RDD family protein [Micromonosporaceae bacterium]|nr:RDD family protein [Micromonosporaceae bacterium]
MASFVDRLLAHLVDGAVFVAVGAVLTIPAIIIYFTVIEPDLFEVRPDGTVAEPDFFEFLVSLLVMYAVIFAISFVLAYIYYVEMMFRSGQTVGKKIMKIKVVPLDPAAALSRGDAAKRFLVQQIAGGLVPFFSYVDGLWQLWDKPYQQCLHDKFAKTVVIKVSA